MKYAHFLSKESAKRKTIPPTRPSIKTANKNTYTRLCLKIKKIHQPIYLKFMNWYAVSTLLSQWETQNEKLRFYNS